MDNTGTQAMFPVYLARLKGDENQEDYNNAIARNENNLNQNFSILYRKLAELEERLQSVQ